MKTFRNRKMTVENAPVLVEWDIITIPVYEFRKRMLNPAKKSADW